MNTKLSDSELSEPRLTAPDIKFDGKELIKMRIAKRVYTRRLRFATGVAAAAVVAAVWVSLGRGDVQVMVVEPRIVVVHKVVGNVEYIEVVEPVKRPVIMLSAADVRAVARADARTEIIGGVQAEVQRIAERPLPIASVEVKMPLVAVDHPQAVQCDMPAFEKPQLPTNTKSNTELKAVLASIFDDSATRLERKEDRAENRKQLAEKWANFPDDLSKIGDNLMSFITNKNKEDENN